MGFIPERRKLTNAEVQRILPHIFLPRKLPSGTLHHLHEANLLTVLRDAIIETSIANENQTVLRDAIIETSIANENQCLDKAANLFNTWANLQQNDVIDPECLAAAISSLVPGDSFALYIREQNAGMLLSIPDDDQHDSQTAILSTFQASPKLSDVMSLPGDLASTYPASSIHIPISEMLKSDTLARQLSILCASQCERAMPQRKRGHSEIQDVPDPILITRLITGALTNENSDQCSHFKTISKTIRDQVNSDAGNCITFRRSGLWMVAKVVLQLCFVNELDRIDGIFLFKMVMVKAMIICCLQLRAVIDLDNGMQMLAKLARRVRKLEEYHGKHNVSQHLGNIYAKLQADVLQTMQRVKNRLNSRWSSIIDADQKKAVLHPVPVLNFMDDTKHLLTASKTHLSPQNHQRVVTPHHILPPKCPPRHYLLNQQISEYPLSHLDSCGEENLGIVLCDFEMYVRKNLQAYANIGNCQDIRKLLEKYVGKAKTYYTNDPVGMSRMILTSLKIIQVLDLLTTNAQTRLKQHRSGVGIDIVTDLLVPQFSDMKLAHELESYFRQRNKSPFPSLIEEGKVSQNAFSSSFARTDFNMQLIRQKILADAEVKIAAKKIEAQEGRRHCANLRSQASGLSHDTDSGYDRWGCYYSRHPGWCTKCSLTSRADSYKVSLYERPLPTIEFEQYAVVFELLIPKEIACLRDSLFFFNTDVCAANPCIDGSSIYKFWTSYSAISSHHNGSQEHVTLGTTTKLHTETCWSRSPESSTDDQFIVENGFNCNFTANSLCLGSRAVPDVKDICSYSIKNDPLYNGMDRWLKHMSHSQNEVLAKQSECPRDMSLSEFKEFGSLRAGHRLQLRNIYRTLQQETLSFHKEPVFSLLCQSVWQTGPTSEPHIIPREAHEDLDDPNFAMGLLGLLSKILEQQSKNWTNYYTMLTLIVLALRTLSLTNADEVKKKASSLLLSCRKVANTWAEKVESVLSKTADFPKDKVTELRLNLITVSVCTGLTYWVDEIDVPNIMKSAWDLECWLRAVARIKDNIILSTAGIGSLPISIRNLLRWVRFTGVMLENRIHILLQQDSMGLHNFINSHWPGARKGTILSSNSCGGLHKQIYQAEFQSNEGDGVVLHMDIIRGDFLLNGCPVGHLPSSITHHEHYARVFSNTIFEVQPTAGQPGTYVTALKYHNSDYSFVLQSSKLIVTETQKNGEEYQLVPNNTFQGDIPFLLINDYSHWWNKSHNTVSFRPISFYNEQFQSDVKYILDLKSFTISCEANNNLLIDINSKSYKLIRSIISRIEHTDYIHMFTKPNGQAIVDLPRMDLHFEIQQEGNGKMQLLSVEYPGMKLCEKQKFGTFVGLTQGLLLDSVNSSFTVHPLFLIPHGNVSIHAGLTHQEVKIDLAALRKPEYFAFEVDGRLCELRAGQSQSGFTYLALLHAATASALPDPFTSLTGTEAALRLLQSPRCWSCQPLDEEVTKTLRTIAQISPKRKYHSDKQNCAERVQWPEGVCSLAAHDGYRMIVQMLLTESQKLSFLNHLAVSNDSNQPTVDNSDTDNPTLVVKSHWRNKCFYTDQAQIALSSEFLFLGGCPPTTAVTTFSRNLDDTILRNVRTITHLGLVSACARPQTSTYGYLMPMLISNGGELEGVTAFQFYPVDVTVILDLNFRQSWIELYMFAKKVKENRMECEWTMLLSTLAFAGTPLVHLELLHIVAVHPEQFQCQNPPPYVNYIDVNENEFNSSVISSLFRSAAISFSDYESRIGQGRRYGEEEYEYSRRRNETERNYNSRVTCQVDQLTSMAQSQWPTKNCILTSSRSNFTEISLDSALATVNRTLNKWYMNRELKHFLQKVEETMFQLQSSTDVALCDDLTQSECFPERCQRTSFFELTFGEMLNQCKDTNIDEQAADIFRTGFLALENEQNYIVPSTSTQTPKYEPFPWPIDYSCKIRSAYMTATKESWKAYHKHPRKIVSVDPTSDNLAEPLERQRFFYAKRAKEMWLEMKNVIVSSTDNFEMNALRIAGLFPRLTPVTLLPLICYHPQSTTTIHNVCDASNVSECIHNLLGATAVLWTLEQRANRCLKYIKGPMEVALKKELVTKGHENWSPLQHPEWLLLELEMDMIIRPVQVEVANAMLEPENGKHAVMQLNMGEGKTTVIIPMVVATLADGKQLCRVTVLKSLFPVNRDSLSFKLGGLLNRCVYTIPCRRDMKIGSSEANTMLQVYKECKAKRGVVLTLPEYRLSFELKGYEKSRNNMFQDAQPLLELQNWLKTNARDLLDESDEILHVKYQLVYTIGKQALVCGGRLRWTVAQRLLKLVPSRLEELTDNASECHRDLKHPERFPHCRLLKLSSYQKLCTMLAEDVLAGCLHMESLDMTTQEKEIVVKFLTDPRISKSQHKKVLQMFAAKVNTSKLDILLVLRGLLGCGVLSLVLNKRWRVNYGVNQNGDRLMAVPFRAKDVAAERTEFGHPDVAILCTIVSYYYSGLSQAQLHKCFEILYLQQNCVEEYERWIKNVTSIDPSINALSGINLADYEQRTKCLYPALLKNMAVIDFWLDRVVFPKEAKQFDFKMTCSAWDLCSDDASLPVTGFSGTNDSKLLLPINISQKDLPKLLGTSGEVLHNLLLPENNNYTSLSPGTLNTQILSQLVTEKIHLLLDVGALMTGLTNEGVAQKWLEIIPTQLKDAAIYFNASDKLVVTNREGRTNLLELSPYRGRMDRCVIYLDDFHTRGTDLKIPRGTKGCVTLGKGVTKDKLVQGCMRMRMIGEGHTVCFLASKEVDDEIKECFEITERKIETRDVLAWAMENSRLVTRDGFLHWTTSGFNYIQKKAARTLFEASDKSNDAILNLGKRCADKDVVELMKMYGTVRREVKFPDLANASHQIILDQFSKSKLLAHELDHYSTLKTTLNDYGTQIVKYCKVYVPEFTRISSLLDEEQERELEHELEEEREIQRPRAAHPASHKLMDGVVKFVQEGIFSPADEHNWAMKLPLALKTTSLWNNVQPNSWGCTIFVTNDFANVVTGSYKTYHPHEISNANSQLDWTDEFLRSPAWVATLKKNDITILLLLSPFEVNQLMPVFRSTNARAVLHMYAARLHPAQDNLFQRPELVVPSTTVPAHYPHYQSLNANLSLFSGNLYFKDKEEQDVYIRFLGLIPQSRTIEEQKVFDNGQTSNGFVPPEFRSNLPHITSPFQTNPAFLVRGIIDCRFDYFPGLSHVASIIVESKKPFDDSQLNPKAAKSNQKKLS